MKVIEEGHVYELDCLKSDGKSVLFKFYRDPKIHGVEGKLDGPSCQEVLRMLIDRVIYLDSEKPWFGNEDIIKHLRMAIALFEARAIINKVDNNNLEIEKLTTNPDGHINLTYEEEKRDD